MHERLEPEKRNFSLIGREVHSASHREIRPRSFDALVLLRPWEYLDEERSNL